MRKLVAGLPVATLLAGCAAYDQRVLEPWVGASRAELVAAWGYPQASTDVVKIDAVTVYTYRNTGVSPDGRSSSCVVSFAIESERVTSARRVGSECRAVARRR